MDKKFDFHPCFLDSSGDVIKRTSGNINVIAIECHRFQLERMDEAHAEESTSMEQMDRRLYKGFLREEGKLRTVSNRHK